MAWIIVAAVGVFVIAFVCVPAIRRDQQKFAGFLESFAPISDDEFLARCRPGTKRDVALGVRRVIADSLSVDYERIHPSARLVADLGAE